MDDAAALRERVHGVTAAAPKTWDESKVKGYDPDYKFDESKVVRDKDPGEEGQFAKKGTGKLSQAEKDKRSFAKWYAKQPKEVRQFLAWLKEQPQDVKDWFEKLSKMTAAQRRAYLGLNDLPDVKEMINGRVNLRQNLPPEQQAKVDKAKSTGEDSAGNPLPKPDVPARKLQEDEVPLKSPSGAKLVDFAAGVGHYADGSTYDINGWHNAVKGSIMATATSSWSPDKRKDAAVKGHALPDGSYPIKDEADWYKAKQAIGRGGPEKRAAIIAHLRKRAKALGIPESELEGLTASVNALTAAPLALDEMNVGAWDESLHPRGRDGKFIDKLGWVSGRFLIPSVGVFNTDRAQVVGFAENTKDPKDPFVVVEKDGQRAYGKASSAMQVAGPKGDITPDEEPKQLSLADAPVQPRKMGPPLQKHYDQIAVDMKAGNDDYGKHSATLLSDKELDQAIVDLTNRIERGELGMSGPTDLKVLQAEKESRVGSKADIPTDDDRSYKDEPEEGEGDPEATELDEERIANSPDELYENLYDQPDDLEQFPEAAETPRAEGDVAPAGPPTATRGQFTYSFDEGNWANAEVWRWNTETGEGEMIGRAHIVAGDKAQFVPNGEGKPFPRTFDNPQELLEVAAERDAPPPGADLMHLDEGRFDEQQKRGANMEPFQSEDEKQATREELRARVKRMTAQTPVDELAAAREKLRKRVHEKAS